MSFRVEFHTTNGMFGVVTPAQANKRAITIRGDEYLFTADELRGLRAAVSYALYDLEQASRKAEVAE